MNAITPPALCSPNHKINHQSGSTEQDTIWVNSFNSCLLAFGTRVNQKLGSHFRLGRIHRGVSGRIPFSLLNMQVPGIRMWLTYVPQQRLMACRKMRTRSGDQEFTC